MSAVIPEPRSATIGLSTYAYLWHMSPRTGAPYALDDVLRSAKDLGVDLVQICDHPPLEEADDRELDRIRRVSESLGLRLEVGTRGIQPPRLRRFLDIATRLEASLVRTMLRVPGHEPTIEECVRILRDRMPQYERRGVSLSVETYEQVPTDDLIGVVTAVDSPYLGVCSDPSNTIAILERPSEVIVSIAPHVNNMHVKDFRFRRREDAVGFELVGAPLGTGLLPYDLMRSTMRPQERGISQVIEQWLPWQGDAKATLAAEEEWNRQSVEFLRTWTAQPTEDA